MAFTCTIIESVNSAQYSIYEATLTNIHMSFWFFFLMRLNVPVNCYHKSINLNQIYSWLIIWTCLNMQSKEKRTRRMRYQSYIARAKEYERIKWGVIPWKFQEFYLFLVVEYKFMTKTFEMFSKCSLKPPKWNNLILTFSHGCFHFKCFLGYNPRHIENESDPTESK
jgi:hypothetical protein